MYKPLANSTLLRMPKKEIIELLRTAEHNAKVSQEYVGQQAENLKGWEPVVRCENCAFSQLDGWACGGTAFMPSHQTFPDSFCDHGTRKDEANEP